MKAGDVLLIDRNHCAGMTVRYILPQSLEFTFGKTRTRKWILIFAMLCSTSAFAQVPKVPKVGGKPLVQVIFREL